MRRTFFTAAFALTALIGLAAPALACPNCKEAASSAMEDNDDPLAEAKAYNRSIYLMLGVPYAIVGFGGFYVYRHIRHQPN